MWKKSLIKIAISLTTLLLLVIVFDWAIDPYMKYRKCPKLKYLYEGATYYDEERYINPGIAKNIQYDAAIVGTSMTENFDIEDVDTLLHVNSIKIPFSGGTAKELSTMLHYLLAQKKAQTIIYDLDYFAFKGVDETSVNAYVEPPFPNELYDSDALSNLKYLSSIRTFEQSLKVLNHTYFEQKHRTFKDIYYWYDVCNFDEKEVLKLWKKRDSDKLLKLTYNKNEYKFKALKSNFDKYLLSYINANQNVKFVVFLPPYSYLSWKIAQERGSLDSILQFKEHLLRTLVQYKNVEIYDFQQDPLTFHLDNFKDFFHYSDDINYMMLEKFASKSDLITQNNLEKHILDIQAQRIKWQAAQPKICPNTEDEDE
jgi:hypothetical protein